MALPQFTAQDLAKYNGTHGASVCIANASKLYDVTNSFLWMDGRHQATHLAGMDLTKPLKQALHGLELIEKFPLIGFLITP
jgi:predicted heme/steroid binding protein